MITLARPFQSGMTLQRGKKIKIWGRSDCEQTVCAYLNGKKLSEFSLSAGDFAIYLPPQEAAEGAVLEIGGVRLENVDIGEVWLAGGQSNMEFALACDFDGADTISRADDVHLRQYTVGRYLYVGEREENPKKEPYFDRWISFGREGAPFFSAVGAYFARELRAKLGVPVALLACNLGGTPALAWIDRRIWERDEELCACAAQLGDISGALYDTMVSEVSGFTARGVLWYQGESDDCRAGIYTKLFRTVMDCWRRDWEENLPFLFVQLAPYGSDGCSTGELYPGVRRAQELAAKEDGNAFMASISDVGEEDNIHPRKKQPVGHRLYLLALDKVYGIPALSDAPAAACGGRNGSAVWVRFEHAEGLKLIGTELPALRVFCAAKELSVSDVHVEGDRLAFTCADAAEGPLRIEFAQTAYYRVNLYNAADIPALPFVLLI